MTTPRRFELVALNDCPFGDGAPLTDTGRPAAEYWFAHVATASDYEPRREWFAVLFLDSQRRLRGHTVLPGGGESFVMTDASQIFRPAFAAEAASIICVHNHPGEADLNPSPGDMNQLRSLISVGRLLNIALTDYVIVGDGGEYASTADMDFFKIEEQVRAEHRPREEDLDLLLSSLLAPAPELVGLVCDAAFKARQPTHDYLFALVRDFVKGHLTGEPGSDPKLSLAARLLRMERTQGSINDCWYRGAMEEGKPLVDFIWDKAVKLLQEFEAAAQPNFNAPSAERVAAASV